MPRLRANADIYDDWHFTKAGLNLSAGYGRQPVVQMQSGEYYRTTREGVNVRTMEAATGRDRGASRPGVSKWLPVQVLGRQWIVQEIQPVTVIRTPDEDNDVQNSQSGRLVYLVAVSRGRVFSALPGDETWIEAVNNTGETPALAITGTMFSAANNQRLYFADGYNRVYFNPATGTVERWAATAGSLPEDSDENYPRLICTWRGRTVQSGLIEDPQNWFMSAVSDPHNYDYEPVSPSATQAVAGNNSSLGFIGDAVMCLIPYSDDVLIFGGDHTIYMMRGDPMGGGQIDLISDSIGMAFGQPWCKDPIGTVYFLSNRTGIYSLIPGSAPVRISQAIETALEAVNTGTNSIRMAWDDRFQGFHVFITPLVAPKATTHYFYEARTGAWWQDRFTDKLMDPLCCTVMDGNEPNDRVTLIGCWDGYVRAIDPTAATDDGRKIESSVVIGPILTANLEEMLLKDMQAVLGESSGDVLFEVFVGSTAEKALTQRPVYSGTWTAGRNHTTGIRRAGHAIYVRLSSTSAWAIESIRARISGTGLVRMRAKG